MVSFLTGDEEHAPEPQQEALKTAIPVRRTPTTSLSHFKGRHYPLKKMESS